MATLLNVDYGSHVVNSILEESPVNVCIICCAKHRSPDLAREGCQCKANISRYLQILIEVDKRVSTLEQTSKELSPFAKRALVDKLNGRLFMSIDQESFKARLRAAKIPFAPKRLNDRRWYLEVGGSERGLYFYLGHPDNPKITKMTSRPSAFAHLDQYLSFISTILSEDELSGFKISRLDLSLDYDVPFELLIRGLDVAHKRAKITYTDNGANRTGLLIGKGNEKLLVYDKSIESQSSSPWSRIEFQLSGVKLPAKNLRELSESLLHSNPFKAVTLNKVSILEEAAKSESRSERIQEIRQLLKREGLLSARKVLNSHRNFDRDYRKLITITPWDEQPSGAFKNNICDFIRPDNGKK